MRPVPFLMSWVCLIILLTAPAAAQTELAAADLTGPRAADRTGPPRAEELRAQLAVLKKRKAALLMYVETVPPDSADAAQTRRALAELATAIEELSLRLSGATAPVAADGPQPTAAAPPEAAPRSAAFVTGSLWSNVGGGDAPAAQPQNRPTFILSVPADRKTNESVKPTLAWTQDMTPVKNYAVTKYIVEVSTSPARNPDGTFVSTVYQKAVDPKGPVGQGVALTEDEKLQPGVRYYWQVLARFIPDGGSSVGDAPTKYLPRGGTLVMPPPTTPPTAPTQYVPTGGGAPVPLPDQLLQLSKRDRAALSEEPRTFTTTYLILQRLADKHFMLQRAFAGTDATEGAQFSVLRTFNKNTVFSTNFALIHRYDFDVDSPTWAVSSLFAVEGALTSDESEAEDAWKFRGGVVLDRGGRSLTSLRGFYLSLAGKVESDQDFEIGKFTFEGIFTPSLSNLYIGAPPSTDTNDKVQFRWRPYLGLDAGHTFRRGDSSETKNTILRLVPRARATLYLNFLRDALGIAETYVYADDTFYFLPLEDGKRRHNFLVSGFNFDVSPNFGFGLTYKNGESAPKFKRVHTLGAVFTVRFGQDN